MILMVVGIKPDLTEYHQKYYLSHKIDLDNRNKHYYENHKLEITEYKKKWKLENKERIAITCKQYYEDNKEEIHRKAKIYRQIHKLEIIEKHKEYYNLHIEESRAIRRKYYQEHKLELCQHYKEKYANNKELFRERKLRSYYKNRDNVVAYRKKNRLIIKSKMDIYRLKMKIDVLTHYGNGKCVCVRCGNDDIRTLSIDHINGGGKKHIQSLTVGLYHWLVNNKYPDGFQTLCMNCQFIKRNEKHEVSTRLGVSL